MRGYKVGDVIKQRREAMGITQEELCLGIFDVSTLSRIENNKHFPSAKSITAIVERFDLSLVRFMVLFTEEDVQIQ